MDLPAEQEPPLLESDLDLTGALPLSDLQVPDFIPTTPEQRLAVVADNFTRHHNTIRSQLIHSNAHHAVPPFALAGSPESVPDAAETAEIAESVTMSSGVKHTCISAIWNGNEDHMNGGGQQRTRNACNFPCPAIRASEPYLPDEPQAPQPDTHSDAMDTSNGNDEPLAERPLLPEVAVILSEIRTVWAVDQSDRSAQAYLDECHNALQSIRNAALCQQLTTNLPSAGAAVNPNPDAVVAAVLERVAAALSARGSLFTPTTAADTIMHQLTAAGNGTRTGTEAGGFDGNYAALSATLSAASPAIAGPSTAANGYVVPTSWNHYSHPPQQNGSSGSGSATPRGGQQQQQQPEVPMDPRLRGRTGHAPRGG